MAAQRTVRLWSGLRASRAVKVGSSGWWQSEHVVQLMRRGGFGTTHMARSCKTERGLRCRLAGQGETGRCPIAIVIGSMTKHGGIVKGPNIARGGE
jgi:hypothetical protein